MHPYLMLAIAIIAEVIATTALKASDGMSKIVPTILVIVGYGLAFWLMSRILQFLPVGMVYAIWTGLGVACIALIGRFVFGETLSWTGVAGIGLIIVGVALLHVSHNAPA